MSEEPKDPQVAQRYRELGKDEPRPETDAAILAAARRAANARPAPLVAPTGRQRWYFPLAAAAVIALAVAVTLHIERGKPDLEDSNTSAMPPAPPQAAKDDPEPKVPPLQGAVPAQRAAPKAPRVENRAEGKREQAASASASPPSDVVGERQAEAPAEQPSAPTARSDAQPRVQAFGLAESAERWLERIVELRKQGRDEEADKQLAEFRKRYPDHKVPEAALRR